MSCCDGVRLRLAEIRAWFQDYDNLLKLSVRLVYAQISCSFIGALGPLYNGVLLVTLAISLFVLVAIESSSQKLARTYAVLLFCSIFLDIAWIALFLRHIWAFPDEKFGSIVTWLVKITLTMQIIGFLLSLSSSILWIQIYRLGAAPINNTNIRDSAFYLRFPNHGKAPITADNSSHSNDDIVGVLNYDASYYSSLSDEDTKRWTSLTIKRSSSGPSSPTAAENTLLNPKRAYPLQIKDLQLEMDL